MWGQLQETTVPLTAIFKFKSKASLLLAPRENKKMRYGKSPKLLRKKILYYNRGEILFFAVPLKNLSLRTKTNGKAIFT